MGGQADTREPFLKKTELSGYASASLLSKAVWCWVNTVLNKGYKSPLKVDEIPSLAPEHRAERLSLLFESKWPKPEENCKHPIRTTLFRCFWKDLAFTAFLAIVKLCATYIGPILINKFVEYTTGRRSSRYEGYYLLVILFLSKFTELFTSHHFNFLSQTLGMKLRSTLITSLYKKSLKLSCNARQSHGVGPIVSYMAVDAQQISDMIPQLHAMWMTPLQVTVAIVLLYFYFGISALVALVVIVLVLFFSLFVTKQNNTKQFLVMKNRDERLKETIELLSNMRVIKFQAWEEHFNKRIQSCRDEEFIWLAKFSYWISGNLFVLWSTSSVISTVLFGTAILRGQPLVASTVFTATTTIRTLPDPLRSFSQSLMQFSQAIISMGRLDTYMMSKELDTESVERVVGCDGNTAVQVEDGVFTWDDDKTEAVLKCISFEVKKGQITAIVGTVGSGKSSLLASVMGEMHKISGKVTVCGTTAYVAQTSWIQNGTIEENILFGLPMNRERYIEALRVCCLEKDLEMLEYGDQTEIGESGINLSGGQKQRIQLARAVYQDCDIYLLDDVFSAVDAQTGSDVFKECVRGALRGKTILLVTHQVDFLHNVDLILVMRDGMIVQSGKYNTLLNSGLDFGALVAAHETSMEVVEKGETMPGGTSPRTPKSPQVSSPHGESKIDYNSVDQASSDNGTSKLVKDEEKETGQVSLSLYKQYCTEALGWWGVAGVVLLSLLWQGSTVATDFWLKYETTPSRFSSFNPSFFIGIYGMITAVSMLMVVARTFFVTIMGLRTAQSFFSKFLHCILHAPMSFFDTTPSGRILSRATSDQTNLDFTIPLLTSLSITIYLSLLSVICIVCIYAWPTAVLLVPLAWANYWYRGYYLSSSRELTRLDQITKAPVIHHFSESIYGFMTIRAFRKQDRFCEENLLRVDSNLRMAFHNYASSEWLGFRLEFLGSLFFCIAAVFMIFLPSSIIDPASVGLSLSYGMTLDSVLFYVVYVSCTLENQMVSVERLRQFTKIPSEAPWEIRDRRPPPNWPGQGNVDIKDLQVRYRPNTPLVLKGINLSIRGGENIGIVGRTGSGKSTLIQVFFRLIEPTGGRIVIDGLDISLLGLHDLRSRLGIIPQEPVLFQGTVRSNIDPIGQYTDDEIWKSLERCQLMDVVAAKPEKLDALVVDHGDNWSVGQKQLLCLGRVMLKRSRLLFMDEATASVDSLTDAVIQKIIREDFADCTVISIAHRIPTVMDCDKVLVIDAGWAKEFDKPSRLLERPTIFAALVQGYSNRSEEL